MNYANTFGLCVTTAMLYTLFIVFILYQLSKTRAKVRRKRSGSGQSMDKPAKIAPPYLRLNPAS
ncbi:MAG: hypothetical protein KAX67_00920 [Pararheinheimera sp.]|nr:hypothetical protein [Rheinheimera sp.]